MYADDTYQIMLTRESPTPESIDVEWRTSILKYMFRECVEWDMEHLVFFLAVNLLDRAVALPEVQDQLRSFQDFQNVTFLCFWIAGKVEGEQYLAPKMVTRMIHDAWTKEQLVAAERDLVARLDWRLHQPLPLYFVWYYSNKCAAVGDKDERDWLYSAAAVVLTCLSVSRTIPHIKPSVLAFSCVAVALHLSGIVGSTNSSGSSGHRWVWGCERRIVEGVRSRTHCYRALKTVSKYTVAEHRSLISVARACYEKVVAYPFDAFGKRLQSLYGGRWRRARR